MDRLRYLLALIACLVITLPLELVLDARVYRRPRLLALTVLPVFAAFAAWDLLATLRGDWSFTGRYLLGPRLLRLPVEEWLFFVVIPVCTLLTYEAVGRVGNRVRAVRNRPANTIQTGQTPADISHGR